MVVVEMTTTAAAKVGSGTAGQGSAAAPIRGHPGHTAALKCLKM